MTEGDEPAYDLKNKYSIWGEAQRKTAAKPTDTPKVFFPKSMSGNLSQTRRSQEKEKLPFTLPTVINCTDDDYELTKIQSSKQLSKNNIESPVKHITSKHLSHRKKVFLSNLKQHIECMNNSKMLLMSNPYLFDERPQCIPWEAKDQDYLLPELSTTKSKAIRKLSDQTPLRTATQKSPLAYKHILPKRPKVIVIKGREFDGVINRKNANINKKTYVNYSSIPF